MKKIILFTMASALSLAASAQTWQDALLLSENVYGGTARSVAMGNALTAVGGDLGSIGLNPAGSAVPAYSTATITTGLSMSVANATSADPDLAFGDNVRTMYTRLKMPNIGVVFNIDTGQRSGLRRVSFGFVSNATQDYTSRMYATGLNATNSFCGSVASSAAGYPQDVLAGNSTIGWWDLDNYDTTYGLNWRDIVAYRSGIIGMVNGRYLGLTDWDKDGTNVGILAPLYQKYGCQTKGYKHDMVMNVAFNYEDEFYWGVNLGITRSKYGNAEYWYEQPNNMGEFPAIPFDTNPNARFNSLQMKRIFESRGTGLYLKAGVLWRPAGTGLRMGAAIQTPTYMNVDTRMAYYGSADVTGVNLPSSQSPEWDDAYRLLSPGRFNAGIAYTFGQAALLSADYEVVNYRHSNFGSQSESDIYYPYSYFDNVNADIKDVLGISHSLRLGTEIKLAENLALRAGYTMTTGAQHNYLEWVYDEQDGKEHLMVFPLSKEERAALVKRQVSLGFGYNNGPYFTDVTFRYRSAPNEYFVPYTNYGYDTDYTDKYEVAAVPEVTAKYNRFDAMITFGVRF